MLHLQSSITVTCCVTVDEGTTALGTIKANEPVNWTVSGTGVSIDSEGAVTLDSPAKWEDASYHTYQGDCDR